ncbi:MAG: hypothetical protein ACI9UA_001018 [Pseudoalteromonas tetraodonis]|jgi:hypothetical protein
MFDQLDDAFVRDISDLLLLERRKDVENVKFTAKTRGTSPVSRFGQLDIEMPEDTMLHCIVDWED